MNASLLHRRLHAELALLSRMQLANESRLLDMCIDDLEVHFTLAETTCRLVDGTWANAHRVCVSFPYIFPAAPMELRLARPVLHPNIHPVSGFVCLWDRHSSANTMEHALLKLEAMLRGRLWNASAEHLMQPQAVDALAVDADATAGGAGWLRSVTSVAAPATQPSVRPHRRRLS